MADENQTPNENAQNAEAQQAQPSFQMVRSYLKDASLEMPHAPEIFFAAPEEQPNVDIQFEVSPGRRLGSGGARYDHRDGEGKDDVPRRRQAGRYFRHPQHR